MHCAKLTLFAATNFATSSFCKALALKDDALKINIVVSAPRAGRLKSPTSSFFNFNVDGLSQTDPRVLSRMLEVLFALLCDVFKKLILAKDIGNKGFGYFTEN
ncbi:MAG: hypothetical protein ACJAVV_003617 [Alphaproteobacteria bacterium]|jgi:hypothetical protein